MANRKVVPPLKLSVPVPLTEPPLGRRISAPVPVLLRSALMKMLLAALSVRLLAVLLISASASVMLPVWVPLVPVVMVTLLLAKAACRAVILMMAESALAL